MNDNTFLQAIANLPPIRDVIRDYKLGARKSLGQHFLHDLNLTARICRTAGSLKNYDILEIGPGPGGLTRALLAAGAKKIIAVERDNRCVAALQDLVQLANGRLEIIEEDALKFDIENKINSPCKVISNLPYNISTALIIRWLHNAHLFQSFTLMFQREVAERIVATSGRNYGRLSVIAQLICKVRLEFNVNRLAFNPPPSVDSSIITLIPTINKHNNIKLNDLESVTKLAFGQRRKMLRSSLRTLGIDLTKIDIDPTLRAENLTIDQFCQIATQIKNKF